MTVLSQALGNIYTSFDVSFLVTEKEYCTPNPCKNSGICTLQQEGYMCSCQPGYRGEICQSRWNILRNFLSAKNIYCSLVSHLSIFLASTLSWWSFTMPTFIKATTALANALNIILLCFKKKFRICVCPIHVCMMEHVLGWITTHSNVFAWVDGKENVVTVSKDFRATRFYLFQYTYTYLFLSIRTSLLNVWLRSTVRLIKMNNVKWSIWFTFKTIFWLRKESSECEISEKYNRKWHYI